jgi:hypothetical protein
MRSRTRVQVMQHLVMIRSIKGRPNGVINGDHPSPAAPTPDAQAADPSCALCGERCTEPERNPTRIVRDATGDIIVVSSTDVAGMTILVCSSCRRKARKGELANDFRPDRAIRLQPRDPRLPVAVALEAAYRPHGIRATLEAENDLWKFIEIIDDRLVQGESTNDRTRDAQQYRDLFRQKLTAMHSVGDLHALVSRAQNIFRYNSAHFEREVREERPVDDEPTIMVEPDPWEHEVDGAALLDEIVTTITRFNRMVPHAAETIALWIVQSHALDAFDIAALLLIWAPTIRCAKTRTLNIIEQLVHRPLTASNITGASLFRFVERYSPTMLFDEAETWLAVRRNGSNDELRGIFNSGHSRGTAYVVRCEGDDNEPRCYSTYCMKALAFNGEPNVLGNTIADRGITIQMRRRQPGEQVEKLRLRRFPEMFRPLKRKIVRWASDHLEDLRNRDPEMPSSLDDRAADNWSALLAIADAAGGHWPHKARAAAIALSSERSDDSRGIELLADMRAIFDAPRDDGDFRVNRFRDANGIIHRLPTAVILESLNGRDDRAWKDARGGKGLDGRELAKLLDPFKIGPSQIRVNERETLKGYERENFVDSWQRYLAPVVGRTPVACEGAVR